MPAHLQHRQPGTGRLCLNTGNGEIDYGEFKSIVSTNLLTAEDDVKETFCVFDRDESGYIGVEEISLMFSRLGHDLRTDYIEAVTDAADLDRDGTITFRGLLLYRIRGVNFEPPEAVDLSQKANKREMYRPILHLALKMFASVSDHERHDTSGYNRKYILGCISY